LDSKSIGTVLLAGKLPHCMKPHLQRFSRTFKDGSCGQTNFIAAMRAQQDCPSGSPRFSAASAPGADKSITPPNPLQVASATFFIAKELMELLEVPWIVHARTGLKVVRIRHSSTLSDQVARSKYPPFANAPKPFFGVPVPE
jgi:hypothetical protein